MSSQKSDVPLVSIIIPAYNARRWIGETIDSALAQTYPNCEIVLIDDGSTDDTKEFLWERYGDNISYTYKGNGGLASARNAGLRIAKGELLQFLDADDLLLPEKVETHARYLDDHLDVDVVYCHTQVFEDGVSDRVSEWDRKHLYQSGDVFAGMLKDGYILIHAPLSRRNALEVVGGFDESIRVTTDWDFWLRVAWSGATFHYLEGPALTLYRAHQDGISHQGVDLTGEGLMVLSKVAAYAWDSREELRPDLRRAEGHWRFRYGKALAEAGHLRTGAWHMARGICSGPRDMDYKVSYLLLALLVGPRRAASTQQLLKRAKDAALARLSIRSTLGK